MSDHDDTDETRIRALLEAWADAVRRHDLPAILAHHEPDIVMFDLPPPLQCKGIEAYEQTWDLLFRYHRPGTAFDIQELAVTAGQDVAFAAAILWCGPDSSSNPADRDGFPFRLTVGLRKTTANGASRTSITRSRPPTRGNAEASQSRQLPLVRVIRCPAWPRYQRPSFA